MKRHVDQLPYRPNTDGTYEKDCLNNQDLCENRIVVAYTPNHLF